MALTEEDLSAMLQPSYPGEGLLSMSLANAMLSSSSAMDSSSRDVFSAQLPYSPLQRAHSMGGPAMNMNLSGVPERSSGMSSMGSLGSGSSASSLSQWPAFSSEEKWELDGKNEVLDRASGAGYGQAQPSNTTQGLQRYHSAPSSFLQSLAEFGEDDFAHITNPLGESSGVSDVVDGRLKYFNENLAPIMESAPSGWGNKEPEKLGVARSNPMNSTEQYFAIQAENSKQSGASRASEVNPRLGVSASRSLKNSLLRQSSSPAELLAAISNQSEDDLISIRPHDDANARGGLFSNPTYAVTGAGGMWKMPTNELFAGKRVRFPEEMTDDSTSDLLLGSDHNRRPGILSRQQSLPSTSTKDPLGGDGPNLTTDLAYDDLLDMFAPCKTRARRGYATHPRSIAERNRRSRISERMKKLQDLVPNMDKQTNTAEMLDEAVEYVKFLQDQVKDLSETIVRLKNGIRQQQQSVAS